MKVILDQLLINSTFRTLSYLLIILKYILISLNLFIDKCQGQCYKGTAKMKRRISELQNKTRSLILKALKMHCVAYNLYLVVLKRVHAKYSNH